MEEDAESNSTAAAFSSDWLTWTPPALPPHSSSSAVPFLPAKLSLGALASLYAAGAAAAAMAHMGVTPWAVRSVGGTMKVREMSIIFTQSGKSA